MKIEPVTEDQLVSLGRCMSPAARIVACLGEVDISKGRGVLEGLNRCLWTKDNRRITISIVPTGGLIASVSKEPDPEAPNNKERNP